MNTEAKDEKDLLRRLLLAKQLYEHALEHSAQAGALNKMIAVHNFHNALEIVLRAIMLRYEIRTERELNIDFETMLNGIDRAACFSSGEQRLPYRTELRKLNAVRNLVQHHVHEPEDSTMEEWRVFSHRFLVRSFDEYFQRDFDSLSSLDFIVDHRLRALLGLSERYLQEGNWKYSACIDKAVFEFARSTVDSLSRSNRSIPFLESDMERAAGSERGARALVKTIEEVLKRIDQVQLHTALLSSGVPVRDYARMRRIPVFAYALLGGTAHFEASGEISEDDAKWLHGFVSRTLIRWQLEDLNPCVPEYLQVGCDKLIAEGITQRSS